MEYHLVEGTDLIQLVCTRGTMMLFDQRPCDGFIEPKCCTACALPRTEIR
jgi:hypothetical protein